MTEEKNMPARIIINGLLAAALVSAPALAQSTSPANPPNTAATDVAPKSQSGHWRSSKLIGVNIYNDQNEKLGDINEIILDPAGKVTGYVVGVGGFLGVGEHDILVEPTKIKFANEPLRSASNAAPNPTTGSANPPAGSPTNTRNVSNTSGASSGQWYPDHGVLSATKDQLKAMPQFKYNNS
jgi:sporulation protein YlmC with PRC-barrel domain